MRPGWKELKHQSLPGTLHCSESAWINLAALKTLGQRYHMGLVTKQPTNRQANLQVISASKLGLL